jgi:RNA polymerase sigma-70 factor (ECF subfamily)
MLRLRRISKVAEKTHLSSTESPDKTQMDSETFDRVRQAIETLPAKYREPVILRYLQELPTEQISKILGISRNALQVRLNRARERLRHILADLIKEKL